MLISGDRYVCVCTYLRACICTTDDRWEWGAQEVPIQYNSDILVVAELTRRDQGVTWN